MSNNENNNGLYFMVGGLLVAVLVIGTIFLTGTDSGKQVVKETNTVVERSVDKATDNESGSSFELNVDDDGFSASTRNSED